VPSHFDSAVATERQDPGGWRAAVAGPAQTAIALRKVRVAASSARIIPKYRRGLVGGVARTGVRRIRGQNRRDTQTERRKAETMRQDAQLLASLDWRVGY
jgi:hypothetical protein